jgi:hypothetical protein
MIPSWDASLYKKGTTAIENACQQQRAKSAVVTEEIFLYTTIDKHNNNT